MVNLEEEEEKGALWWYHKHVSGGSSCDIERVFSTQITDPISLKVPVTADLASSDNSERRRDWLWAVGQQQSGDIRIMMLCPKIFFSSCR